MERLSVELSEVFTRLRKVLAAHSKSLVVVEDSPRQFYLNTNQLMPNGRSLFFGSVRLCKGYVSFHLMPLYLYPDLLRRVSTRLMPRMHGKSCFNFKKLDAAQLADLTSLSALGIDRYRREGKL
jgi:hypothetical protein